MTNHVISESDLLEIEALLVHPSEQGKRDALNRVRAALQRLQETAAQAAQERKIRIPEFECASPKLVTVRFSVTAEDVVATSYSNGSPVSGLISKFEATMLPVLGPPVPKDFKNNEITHLHKVVITFHKSDDSFWAQKHEMLVKDHEILVNKRWPVIGRALGLLRNEYRVSHDMTEAPIEELAYVQIGFYVMSSDKFNE